jgi:hypothetical protein
LSKILHGDCLEVLKTLPAGSVQCCMVSYGGGVNSTAMLVEMNNRGIVPDYIVFADTGDEWPETDEYLDVMRSWIATVGFPELTIVHGELRGHYSISSLSEAEGIIPLRWHKWCMENFKKKPIAQFKREHGITVDYIGIAADEAHRAHQRDHKQYPLVEWGITRRDCERIIEAAGLPIPAKSGCWICPNKGRKSWQRLLDTHPELFARAEELEKVAEGYPELTYYNGKTLTVIRENYQQSDRLFDDDQFPCAGVCGT